MKTAGTNWLEALKVVAKNDPEFMVEIYRFAIENLDNAKAYYHVDATVDNSLSLASVDVDNVFETLVDDMSRQVLHITYGLILNEKKDNQYIYRDKLYAILMDHESDYKLFLNEHIDRHLKLLGK